MPTYQLTNIDLNSTHDHIPRLSQAIVALYDSCQPSIHVFNMVT